VSRQNSLINSGRFFDDYVWNIVPLEDIKYVVCSGSPAVGLP
jgi:hypothetical protein